MNIIIILYDLFHLKTDNVIYNNKHIKVCHVYVYSNVVQVIYSTSKSTNDIGVCSFISKTM
jgi:hypothetical protein